MINRSTRAAARRPWSVSEPLESRRLLAAVFDSGGFESPRYTTGPLEGQDAQGPWLQDSTPGGTAQVQTEVVEAGQQAVRMVRTVNPGGDTRYGVTKPFLPTGILSIVRISWDMNVAPNQQPNVPFGPFFGVEAYDATVTPVFPRLVGSLGVDATTGDVLFQDGTTGFLTEAGFDVQLGEWNHFTLELNYDNKTYTVFVNGDEKASTGFVDDGVLGFTDAPLAALAATAESKPIATGTAFFDNYVIDAESNNPQPPRVTQVYVSGSEWEQDFRDYLEDKGYGDEQYGYAITARDQLNELPWVNLNQVSIRFSEDVNVDASDLEIRGVNVPTYALDPSAFHYDAATRTATWRLANGQTFDNDRIVLDLDGDVPNGVKDKQGVLLDGDWTNPGGPDQGNGDRYPSGDGEPGGDFEFRLNVLAGDTERDGIVLARDYAEVKKRFFSSTKEDNLEPYSIYHDTDGSGIILARDYAEVKERFFNALPSGEPGDFSTAAIRADRAGSVLLA